MQNTPRNLDEVVAALVELSLEYEQISEVGSIYAVYIAVGAKLTTLFKEMREQERAALTHPSSEEAP